MYTPEKTVRYESTVSLFAKQAMVARPPLQCAVAVEIEVRLPVPASWSQRKRALALAEAVLPETRPDLDNVIKAITDACNAVVYDDDRRIVSVSASKHYAEHPGVSVKVLPLGGARDRLGADRHGY